MLRSWLDEANSPQTDFPLDNLPYGVFSPKQEAPRCGVAIGTHVVDLAGLEQAGLIPLSGFDQPTLNGFMAKGKSAWVQMRARLIDLLSEQGDPALRENALLCGKVLVPQTHVQMHLPFHVAGYTDFYAGRHHAENVGTMFRGPENALPPNWLSIPIGYNGRASTVVVSGTPVQRPWGQVKPADASLPSFSPSKRLDIELELGAVVGQPTAIGQQLSVAEADDLIFGYVLLNDWSARDVQAWEYQPLGPFQAKAFATSISPWVVTAQALAPFRVVGPQRSRPLLPYLQEHGRVHYDIQLEVRMRTASQAQEQVISRTTTRELYYAPAQQLAHHASSGCKMEVGDLLGSGTISGPTREERGSLLEITWGGQEPLVLEDGTQRKFLEDGDSVSLAGWAQGAGYRIGFGTCTGTILPALPLRTEWQHG